MTSQFQSLREENKKIHPLVCWLVRHCALTDTATTDSFAVQVKCTVSDKLDRHARCKQLYKIRLVGGELSFQQEDLNPNLLKAVTVGFFLLHTVTPYPTSRFYTGTNQYPSILATLIDLLFLFVNVIQAPLYNYIYRHDKSLW